MKKILLYMESLAHIGGIETSIYYFTEELRNYYDIELIYKKADKKQLARLNIKTEKLDTKKRYYGDIVIKESAYGQPQNIYGNVYIQMIHANYSEIKNYKYNHWFKTDKIIAVSDNAKASFLKLFPNYEVDVIYNYVPQLERKPKIHNDKLILLSATRLTSEKGWERMVKLANELDKNHIDYTWYVYTNANKISPSPNMIFKEPKLGLTEEMRNATYIVQLSDTESYCYTIHESMSLGTPVIVTNWSGQDVRDGIDGYVLDMNMKNLRLNKIVNEVPKDFDYNSKSSVKNWIDYFENLKLDKIKVKALKHFSDIKEGVERYKGDIFEVTEERMNIINNCDYCKSNKLKLVERIK